MNEPPPPYSVKEHASGLAIWSETKIGQAYRVQSEMQWDDALKWRDRLNAAYMQGWRDRDEREGEDE